MSWDVKLVYEDDDGKFIEYAKVHPHEEGGTYAAGGIDIASLNITYNYYDWYRVALDKKRGLDWLNGQTAENCISRLEEAIEKLGTAQHSNYWKSTAGNAGYALKILFEWARKHPTAKFCVC